MTSSSGASHLDLYEPLEVIGNGSFGIIRKVRRKADGVILARKELNFERMSDRDRKQIVAEVNILKDLHHENIVRYIDRFVDRDAGILYILMEYCDGGDLAGVIKQCAKMNRPLPEDTVWSYFFQLLLALQHCHCPNAKSGDSNGANSEVKRQQILHRDVKPENVFLSGNNTIKLGDFGLSKALGQTSFANTYVGTPYYMSPELIQEKSYDTKSDIWSLGCLIYELCATKPPFAEAQTHSELSMLIRNGRIPPLPKGYSHSLNQVIKAMLNLNPAMRPSAQQLLQHERIDFARKVSEAEKMLVAVKSHKTTMLAKERELQAMEASLTQREAQFSSVISQKDSEISHLTSLLAIADQRAKEAVAAREEELKLAVIRREEEVAAAIKIREDEIMMAVNKRDEEVGELWRHREDQLRKELDDGVKWVLERQKELESEAERLESARKELEKEAAEVERRRTELEATEKAAKENATKVVSSKGAKSPFEEVQNILAPLSQLALKEATAYEAGNSPRKGATRSEKLSVLDTPITRPTFKFPLATPVPLSLPTSDSTGSLSLHNVVPGSAMRGVVLTATGQPLATPRAMELNRIIRESPKVGLNFKKIFDFDAEEDASDVEDDVLDARSAHTHTDVDDNDTKSSLKSARSWKSSDSDEKPVTISNIPRSRPASPAKPSSPSKFSAASRREKSRSVDVKATGSTMRMPASNPKLLSKARAIEKSHTPSQPPVRPNSALGANGVPKTVTTTRIRRPSVTGRPTFKRTASVPASSSCPSGIDVPTTAKESRPNSRTNSGTTAVPPPTPRYDHSDDENLPSPFLRRVERIGTDNNERTKTITTSSSASSLSSTTSTKSASTTARRRSNGNALRAIAAANSANAINAMINAQAGAASPSPVGPKLVS